MKLGKIGSRSMFGWRNPYVTDGLVAMWDGEWNAGGGVVHDPEATTWKNLVSGSPFGDGERIAPGAGFGLSTKLPLWTDKSCYSPETYTGYEKRACFGVTATLKASLAVACGEVVARARSATPSNSINATAVMGCDVRFNQNNSDLVRPNATFAYSATKYQWWACATSFGGIDPTVVRSYHIRRAGGGLGFRVDGGNESTGGKSSGGTENIPSVFPLVVANFTPVEVFVIRYYSRALTAEEIAANFAVDNARFNLTGGGVNA